MKVKADSCQVGSIIWVESYPLSQLELVIHMMILGELLMESYAFKLLAFLQLNVKLHTIYYMF